MGWGSACKTATLSQEEIKSEPTCGHDKNGSIPDVGSDLGEDTSSATAQCPLCSAMQEILGLNELSQTFKKQIIPILQKSFQKREYCLSPHTQLIRP